MVAGQNLKRLAQQVKEFAPKCVAIQHEADVPRLRRLLGSSKVEILWGQSGAAAVATAPEVEVVLAAIVGGAGLMPSLEGLLAGKEIALANKEALVMAGEIFVRTAKKKGVRLLRSEEHTSELQSQSNLVCRLLLEKKKKIYKQ